MNLDDDIASIAQYRGVDLPETGAAKRLRFERLEQLADPRVELLLDGVLDVLE